MANPHPTPRKPVQDKPFRDALRMEIADAGVNHRKLRRIARALLDKAGKGDVQAIREVADRIDGKVPQAVVGDDAFDPIRIEPATDEQRAKALAVFIAKTRQG